MNYRFYSEYVIDMVAESVIAILLLRTPCTKMRLSTEYHVSIVLVR